MRIITLWFVVVISSLFFLALIDNVTEAKEPAKKVFAADKGPNKINVSGYPKEIQESYKVFAAKCVKCHTLARPINTDMTNQGWKMYVKRMMNKPDSGISPKTGKMIYKFLKYRQEEKNKKRAH